MEGDEKMESDEDIDDLRLYWNQPELVSQLSEEQRRKVVKRFFELVEKSKEENARRMSKILRERCI